MPDRAANVFILNDTRSDLHHGCSIVMRNLLAGLDARECRVAATLPCGSFLKAHRPLEKAFERSTVIVLNGEGTLHHDRPYARYLLSLVREAAEAGKSVHVINVSWEENSAQLADCLRDVRQVWTRDIESAEELGRAGIHARIASDLTFHSRYEKVLPGGSDVIVTDSVLAERASLLASVASRHGFVRVPMIQPPVITGAGARPSKWLKYHAYRWLISSALLTQPPRQHYQDLCFSIRSTEQWRSRLLASAAMISGRYHGTCLALQHLLPVLSVESNTSKIRRLMQAAGLDASRRMVTPDELHTRSCRTGFRHWLSDRTAWSREEVDNLSGYLDNSRSRLDTMFDEIAADARA